MELAAAAAAGLTDSTMGPIMPTPIGAMVFGVVDTLIGRDGCEPHWFLFCCSAFGLFANYTAVPDCQPGGRRGDGNVGVRVMATDFRR